MDKKQHSASLHDIMDSETFLGPSVVPHQGVDTPLTAIGMFSDFSGSDGDGTERASDIDMEEGRVRKMQQHTSCMLYTFPTQWHCSVCVCDDLYRLLFLTILSQAGPTRSFNNPAYDLENRKRQQIIPPPMIAASSTDDIILLSKKNRAGVSPRHPMAQPAGKDTQSTVQT